MAAPILCPTRGGEASFPNQDRAIAIAKENETGILFLYVSNVQFLGLTAYPVVVDIQTELEEMGEFMLAMAEERAEKAGVRAQSAVRSGVFRQELKEVIREHEIETVVMGRSAGRSGVVTEEFLENLIEEVIRDTGVEFIVVDQGEIIGSYKPV
jgi:nucleotide-binding universal stress UspA family protein